MTYPLAPNGVFWTVQGEGALTGTPMIFIRLAGCSVGCANCDTDYRVAERLPLTNLIERVKSLLPASFVGTNPWAWITGGEPTDHDLQPLIDALHEARFVVAVATAGMRMLPPSMNLNWLSVSAHFSSFPQKFGHELKVVPGLNGLTWAAVEEIDRNCHSFCYRYVQPLTHKTLAGPEADGAADLQSLQECIGFVKSHPGWRLGTQAHKSWGVP